MINSLEVSFLAENDGNMVGVSTILGSFSYVFGSVGIILSACPSDRCLSAHSSRSRAAVSPK